MNVKSILKLSIMLMLVLVLIPAVAAEDSSESFYIEFAESEDVIVEESCSIEEVECGIEDQTADSHSSEVDNAHEKLKINEAEHPHEEISAPDNNLFEEDYDPVSIESEEGLFDVAHDIEKNDDIHYISGENFTDILQEDINEDDCEMTIEDVGVISQGSLFVSKHDYNFKLILIFEESLIETTSFESSNFKRSLSKILELKNNILISQDVEVFASDLIAVADSNVIVCISKISSDYVFSIDNSVFGKGNTILIFSSCFLKYDYSFNSFSCDFLTFQHFFAGFSIISDINAFMVQKTVFFIHNSVLISCTAFFSLNYEVKHED